MNVIRNILFTVVLASLSNLAFAEDTFNKNTILKDASDFLGEGTEGLGEVIEKLFEDLGEPNAYIKGQEASGALGVGARYGDGTLIT